MLANLEIIPAARISIKYPDGTSKSERHFLDFVVDGASLWQTIGKSRDTVSVFCLSMPLAKQLKLLIAYS
jgi:hypothetical protein